MLKKMHNSIDEETVNYLLAKYGNDRNQEINFFNFLQLATFEKAPQKSKVLYSPRMKVQVAPKEEFSVNDWKTIKQRIDLEYERKLKEVSDAALQKL